MRRSNLIAVVETKDYRIYSMLEKLRISCIAICVIASLSLVAVLLNAANGDFKLSAFVTSLVLIGISIGLYILVIWLQGARLLSREWAVKVIHFTLFIECIRPCGEDEGIHLMTYQCPIKEIECIDQLRPGFTTIWRHTDRGDIKILTICPADIIMLALQDAVASGNTSHAWVSSQSSTEESEEEQGDIHDGE